MRPSSADTSEPACVKRKMLSMNSSVSAPVSSRKYSAIVSARQGDAKTRAGRLVHLAEDHDGLVDDVLAGVADLGFLHFQPEVGAFAGAFADAGEDGVAAVLLGDTGDEFLDDDGLAEARAAEQAGLAAAKERREQVDHLDAGLEDFGLGRQVDEFRRLAVDRAALGRVDRPAVVDRLAEQVEHAAERFLADRHGHRPAGVDDSPCRGAGRRSSRARPRGRFPPPRCCCDFAGQLDRVAVVRCVDLDGVVDRGELVFGELGVERRADDLRDLSGGGHCVSSSKTCSTNRHDWCPPSADRAWKQGREIVQKRHKGSSMRQNAHCRRRR